MNELTKKDLLNKITLMEVLINQLTKEIEDTENVYDIYGLDHKIEKLHSYFWEEIYGKFSIN